MESLKMTIHRVIKESSRRARIQAALVALVALSYTGTTLGGGGVPTDGFTDTKPEETACVGDWYTAAGDLESTTQVTLTENTTQHDLCVEIDVTTDGEEGGIVRLQVIDKDGALVTEQSVDKHFHGNIRVPGGAIARLRNMAQFTQQYRTQMKTAMIRDRFVLRPPIQNGLK